MDIFAAQSFRVLLAVTLAANCCLPCYTLAYADELDDWGRYEQLREDQPERSGDGQADQGPDFQGVLRHEAPEEASPCSELPPAAGAGRFRPSAHVLVEASYSLADSLIRLSTARAYADESQEVEDVPQEEQEEVAGDAGGFEFAPGVGESISHAADAGAAAEGHGSDDGAAAGAGGDSSEDNGSIASPVVYDVEPSADFPLFDEGNGEIDDSYGGNVWDDASSLSDYGIMPLGLTEVGYLDKIYFAVGANSTAGSEQTTVGSYKWSTVKYTINWVASWILLCVYRIDQNVQAIAPDVKSILNNLGYANNYLKAIDTSTKNYRSDFGSAWGYGYGGTSVIEKNSPAYWLEWLYNYSWGTYTWPGSTSQSTKGLIDALALISTELYDYDSKMSVGKSAATLLSDIRKQWGYGYGGTSVIFKNSPAYWLEYLYNYSWLTATFPGSSSSSTKGFTEVLGLISTQLYDYSSNRNVGSLVGGLLSSLNSVSDRFSRSNAWGYDYSSSGGNYYASSPAGWLNSLYRYSFETAIFPGSSSYSTKGFTEVLGLISTQLYDYSSNRTVGSIVGDIGSYSASISSYLESILAANNSWHSSIHDDLTSMGSRLDSMDSAFGVRLANIALGVDDVNKSLVSSLQWLEVLHGDMSMLRHGAADLIAPEYASWTVWDFLQGIYFDAGQMVDLLKGLQLTLTAWGSRWDSQDLYLMEWAKRWDALDKSPVDLGETNKLLGRLTGDVASIRDKYVVGDTLSDMFGSLVGDLQVPATAAAIDGIKGAMSTVFPFCIPSVVNLALFGSVVAEPQAPCWEFDIAGCPLVVDFAPYGDFAEVCRWTVRLLFVAALLLNTRKFVYGAGGAY